MSDICTITAVLEIGPILVLAPHPDDESLGCGVLLARAFQHKGAIVACLTDGAASHIGSPTYSPAKLAACRKRELFEAVMALGGTGADILSLDLADSHPPSPVEIEHCVATLVDTIQTKGVRSIFTTSRRDPHCDHKLASKIAQHVCSKISGLRLFEYPVWSRWIGDMPDDLIVFSDDDCVARKSKAIAAHRSQQSQIIDDADQAFTFPSGFANFFASEPEVFEEISL